MIGSRKRGVRKKRDHDQEAENKEEVKITQGKEEAAKARHYVFRKRLVEGEAEEERE